MDQHRTARRVYAEPGRRHANPGTLYVDAEFSSPSPFRAGIYRTSDGGASWNRQDSLNQFFAIDPQNPATLYGQGYGGLMKSVDGGITWATASDGLSEGSCHSVVAIAIDPQDSSTIYAALTSNPQSGARCGGVWKSADGATTWAKAGLLPAGGGVDGLAIDPINTRNVYGWNGKGIFKSTDAGASWSAVSGVPAYSNSFVVIDPQNPSTLYAGLYDCSNGGCPEPGPGFSRPGIFKSTDGGESWTELTSGPQVELCCTAGPSRITGIAVDPLDSDVVYAASAAGPSFGAVYQITDGGASWIALQSSPAAYSLKLVIDSQNIRTLYATTEAQGIVAIRLVP